MVKDDRKKCTLKFKSRGDLRSALNAAEKWGIAVKDLSKRSEFLLSIPADRAGAFQSLGSINFGIEVRA
ncbi:MAG: hypothetical protein ACD_7C00096G0018 [uncultured bacterium]|nr:MAG: hypothetical protein ACD_7C00096G0018 [uncultured bacterium]KKP69874.1 MAG: hypothetical protein UR65_C0046G0001 [Candidatus Moranbacteria bacterium GW2011_GWE2_35_164]HBR79277.1 hypothetical protein [Candidatus Moranbacteria bacterium]